MVGRGISNVGLVHVCERGCSPEAKQKGKDENTAIITEWNKCPLALVMEGQMFWRGRVKSPVLVTSLVNAFAYELYLGYIFVKNKPKQRG